MIKLKACIISANNIHPTQDEISALTKAFSYEAEVPSTIEDSEPHVSLSKNFNRLNITRKHAEILLSGPRTLLKEVTDLIKLD